MLSVLKEKTLEVTLEQCRGTFYFFDLRFDLRFFFFLRNGNLFIYLFFLAALGLCCCLWAFSSCGEQGLLFIMVHGLLIAVASLVAEPGL